MNWAHLHLALNHVPVLGTLFLLLLFAVGLIRRSAELQRVSLWAFVVLTAVSIPIKFTGDQAYSEVMTHEGIADGPVAAHEQAADQATTGVFALGLIAAAGLFISRGQRPLTPWLTLLLLAAGLGTFLLMARAANLGGQIRHPEIRPDHKTSETAK
jgi:uncharacterized membrane protein